MKGNHPLDPTGLIYEAYRIDGVTDDDCRGIFFDWAIGQAGVIRTAADVQALLDTYGPQAPDHPMTAVLREGAKQGAQPAARRGGAKARRGQNR